MTPRMRGGTAAGSMMLPVERERSVGPAPPALDERAVVRADIVRVREHEPQALADTVVVVNDGRIADPTEAAAYLAGGGRAE